MQIGSYVEYKDKVQLVLEFNEKKALIINPLEGNVKLTVGLGKLELLNFTPAIQVSYNSRMYLVTKRNLIISLGTGRIMNWPQNSGEYKSIIGLADVNWGYYKHTK